MKHLSPPASFAVRFVAIALALGFAAVPLGAQSPRTGTLTGRVLDEAGVPVANVEVAIAKVERTTRTDSVGKFTLALMPPGQYDLVLRRVSYAPMVFVIAVSAGDTTEAEVKMNSAPQPMSTVLVEERPERRRELDGFESRRRLGVGHFITRGQIEQRDPHLLSDMVRLIPGATFLPAGMGRSVLRFSRAQGSRDCPPTYFVDGILVTGYNLDDMSVSDVEAVELYSGLSGLPAQFAKTRSTINCGTVAIWTRIPGNPKKK